MSIYQDIGLDKVINCSGKMTALGVSKISDKIAGAMKAGGQSFVIIDDLIDKAGEIISAYTAAEDTCVTCSASAGIAISIAAVITKGSRSLIEKSPFSGQKNEIVIQKGHMINFGAPIETMIQLGGGKIVEAGTSNKVLSEHLEASITDNTVALFYVKSHHCVQKGMVSLEDMIKIAKKYNLPIIVDAAAEGDLKKYIRLGADLVIYSGAKAIEGPSSGFITGRADLIISCKRQYLGIARAMKIGKENIMGLVSAIETYMTKDIAASVEHQKYLVSKLIEGLESLEGIETKCIGDEAGRPIYRAEVKVHEQVISMNCKDLVTRLKSGKIKVVVRDHFANIGKLSLDVRSIDIDDIPVIINKFKEALS